MGGPFARRRAEMIPTSPVHSRPAHLNLYLRFQIHRVSVRPILVKKLGRYLVAIRWAWQSWPRHVTIYPSS